MKTISLLSHTNDASVTVNCVSLHSVESNDHSERKSLQVNGSSEEVKPDNDIDLTEAEANRSSDPGETLPTEGGKKDPSVRREELLVKSELAEVCCFDITVCLHLLTAVFQLLSLSCFLLQF